MKIDQRRSIETAIEPAITGPAITGPAITGTEGALGDPRALAGAYLEHGAAVFQAAHRVCSWAAAEDVTQDVFVHLWRHPERFDTSGGPLRALLVTAARHRALDIARSESSRRTREKLHYSSGGPVAFPETDRDLLDEEQATWIAEAVRRLPEHEQTALTATFFGHCTYREAALLLGQPEGTTKARIRSGLHRLGLSLVDSPMRSVS